MGNDPPLFVTLGLFIIDDFDFKDEHGKPTGKNQKSQIGGGGTYAIIGARMWLPPNRIGMIVDKGYDFPNDMSERLLSYGDTMWMFRQQPACQTTRALNIYRGEYRDFKYLTDRIRLSPRDITGTRLGRARSLHFVCSPKRAAQIMSEVREVDGWKPTTIYEPIPDSCIPESLPALKEVLQRIDVLSPNAEEALSLLSLPLPPTKSGIEKAAKKFLDHGIGVGGNGSIVIRCGELGAYVKARGKNGAWVGAYWANTADGVQRVVDVTGAGNSFLGGVAAGLHYTDGDIYEAAFFGAVSASFTIEQEGLPTMTPNPASQDWPLWNGDSPTRRLEELRKRHGK